jgi:hypothetical protein
MKPAGSFPICWKKKFLSRNIGIKLYSPFPQYEFESLLSCLPNAKDDEAGVYQIRSTGKDAYSLGDPAGKSRSCNSWFEAFYLMDSLIYDELFSKESSVFIFHSAAVRHRRSGKILWMMGPSMSGKSSLSLGLIKSGAFDYLSEEAIGIHPPSGGTMPFPRAWRLRGDCREILGPDPSWEFFRDDHHPRAYVKPPSDRIVAEELLSKPAAVLLLSYVPNTANPFFSPVSPGLFLANLMTFCVNAVSFLTSERIAFLAEYCREMPAFTLQWCRVQETVAAVAEGLNNLYRGE